MLRLILLVILLGTTVVVSGCGQGEAPLLAFDQDNADKIAEEFAIGAGGGGGGGPNPLEDPNRTPQWAMIKGVIRASSSVSPGPPRSVNKDQGVCGSTVPNLRLVIGSNNGIKDALIYLEQALPRNDADAGEPVWVHGSYSYDKVEKKLFPAKYDQQKPETIFDQQKCVFLSHVFAMRTDQRMMIKNSDPTGHNTNIAAKKGRQFNEIISAGGVTYYQPIAQEDAPFPVSCNMHGWMGAWMIVRDNPYFAVTGDDGSFEIANVPAGVPLTYRLWLEAAKSLGGDQVKVTLNGAELEVKRGKFKLKLEKDQSYEIEVVVDASALGST